MHQIVYFATGADVGTVIVGGEVLMGGFRVPGVDMPAVLQSARREQEPAFRRAGTLSASDRPSVEIISL